MAKVREIETNMATLITEQTSSYDTGMVSGCYLTRADDTLTPISSSNFIPSISLSAIQEVPLISSSSAQDSGYITLDKLFEQFHITYEAYSFYQSKFFQTAQLKHLIKKALDQGDDINIQDSFNHTVLHKAIYRKLYDIAEFLLEKGAATELKDLDGYTPLQLVIHEGYTEMVKLLIIYGADHRDKKLIELVPDDKPELKAFLSLAIASQNNNSSTIDNSLVTTKDIEKLNDTTNFYTGSRISKIVVVADENPEELRLELAGEVHE
ncbi:ankyrin repeat domain-containing protein [Rickettsia conorii]|uniref:ankyrin repeat domain-containing protein n=1 Tax=Rickettsia conorii TaxID=781 RepID=UPI000A8F6E59|nr:ankyrin repeat domain-containing protein [Rickettsia conorii]